MEITVESHNKRSLLCSDELMVTSLVHVHLHKKEFPGKASFRMTFNQEDLSYVKANGLSLIPLCDKLKNAIPDIISTIAIFFNPPNSKIIPPWLYKKLVDQNYRRVEKLTGAIWVDRKIKTPTTLDWINRNVKSGDIYCVYGEAGMGDVILFATGGVCSHVGMFLWEKGVLWMVETNPPQAHRQTVTDWWNTGGSNLWD